LLKHASIKIAGNGKTGKKQASACMQKTDIQRVIDSVNLLANAYAGSNPALPTIFIINGL
jgi:hypothetical protein